MPQDVRIKVDVEGNANEELKGINDALLQMGTAAGGSAAAGIFVAQAAFDALKEGAELVFDVVSAGIEALAEFVTSSTEYAIEIESAFAGVLKTTDGLGDSYFELTSLGEQVLQDFKNLSLAVPEPLDELLGVGELAGQLGVAAEVLADFALAISAFSVATNVDMESATNDVAKFLNIFGTSSDEFVDHANRMMSSVVDVGNKYASTEREILDGASRLAQVAIFGFTEADVIGMANAWASMGLAPDAYGNSVAKVMRNINTAVELGGSDLQLLAEIANMSADSFSKAWLDDPMKAFEAFIGGLEDGRKTSTLWLEELGTGWKDARIIRALAVAASNMDLFTGSVADANLAWDENIALMVEAEKRWNTTESMIGILANAWDMFKLSFAEPILEVLNEQLQGITSSTGFQMFLNFAEEVGGRLANGIASFIKMFQEFASDPAVAEFMKQMGKEFLKALDLLIPQLLQMSKIIFPRLLAILPELVDFTRQFVNLLDSEMFRDGLFLATHFLGGLILIFGALSKAMGYTISVLAILYSQMKAKFLELSKEIPRALSNLANRLQDIGRDAMQGLINGLWSKWGQVLELAKNIANSVAQTISEALKIKSPSKVTEYLGEQTVEGFKVGMEKASNKMFANEGNFMPTINIVNPSIRDDMDITRLAQAVQIELNKANRTYRGGYASQTV